MLKNIIIVLFLTTTVTFAQMHPIDRKLSASLDKDGSTMGMCAAYSQAANEWDKELNNVYKKLMKVLDKNKQNKLKEAQRLWVTYKMKNDEISMAIPTCYEGYGTVVQVQIPEMKMNTVKYRTLELNTYYQYAKDGNAFDYILEDNLTEKDKGHNEALQNTSDASQRNHLLNEIIIDYSSEIETKVAELKKLVPNQLNKTILDNQKKWTEFQKKNFEFLKEMASDSMSQLMFNMLLIRHRCLEATAQKDNVATNSQE